MPKHHLYVIGNNNAALINAARGATKLGDEFLLPVEGGVNTLARGDLLLLTVNSNEAELALPPVVFRTEARQDNARHRRFVVQRVLSTPLPMVNGLRNLIHEYQPAIVFLKRGELIELNDDTAVALLMEMQGGDSTPLPQAVPEAVTPPVVSANEVRRGREPAHPSP